MQVAESFIILQSVDDLFRFPPQRILEFIQHQQRKYGNNWLRSYSRLISIHPDTLKHLEWLHHHLLQQRHEPILPNFQHLSLGPRAHRPHRPPFFPTPHQVPLRQHITRHRLQ